MAETDFLSQQFFECIQAISRLMQGVNELQDEIREYAQTGMEHKIEIKHLNDRVRSLQHLVQGEGGDASVQSMLAAQKTKIEALEIWKRTIEEDNRVGKNTKVSWITLIVASSIAIIIPLLTTFIPFIIQILQKKTP